MEQEKAWIRKSMDFHLFIDNKEAFVYLISNFHSYSEAYLELANYICRSVFVKLLVESRYLFSQKDNLFQTGKGSIND